MNPINILLIEDNVEQSNAIVNLLEENQFNVVGVARTYEEAIILFTSKNIDFIIIDIFLEGQPKGIDFADVITSHFKTSIPFMFLTSSIAREIFERAKLTKPFRYMVKPFNELDLIYTIETAVEEARQEKNTEQEKNLTVTKEAIISKNYILFQKKNALIKVHMDEIIYIEADNKYSFVHTEKEKFLCQISIIKISEILNPNVFHKVHRKYIINIHKLKQIVPSENIIIMEGDRRVNLSKRLKDAFIEKFHLFK